MCPNIKDVNCKPYLMDVESLLTNSPVHEIDIVKPQSP